MPNLSRSLLISDIISEENLKCQVTINLVGRVFTLIGSLLLFLTIIARLAIPSLMTSGALTPLCIISVVSIIYGIITVIYTRIQIKNSMLYNRVFNARRDERQYVNSLSRSVEINMQTLSNVNTHQVLQPPGYESPPSYEEVVNG